ncbi:hypothetical protein LLH32_11605 [Bacillus nakamurai]|nr:hypothetical protein [Bacillus nakamurai]
MWYGHAEQYEQQIGPLDRLHKQLQEKGIEVPAVSLYTDFVSQDERQSEQNVLKALNAARQLHSPLIRVFAGNFLRTGHHRKSGRAPSANFRRQPGWRMTMRSISDLRFITIRMQIRRKQRWRF